MNSPIVASVSEPHPSPSATGTARAADVQLEAAVLSGAMDTGNGDRSVTIQRRAMPVSPSFSLRFLFEGRGWQFIGLF